MGGRGWSRLLPQLNPPAPVLHYLAVLLTDLAERRTRQLQVSSGGVRLSGRSVRQHRAGRRAPYAADRCAMTAAETTSFCSVVVCPKRSADPPSGRAVPSPSDSQGCIAGPGGYDESGSTVRRGLQPPVGLPGSRRVAGRQASMSFAARRRHTREGSGGVRGTRSTRPTSRRTTRGSAQWPTIVRTGVTSGSGQ
jgi:hypothetical protein